MKLLRGASLCSFQSQLGSIGASLVRLAPISCSPFQSQLGSIGALLALQPASRLCAFQSQLGSIGARYRPDEANGRPHFQSQLGSIGAFKVDRALVCCAGLSIPAWFDWRDHLIGGASKK